MAEEAHVPAAAPEQPPEGVQALGDYLLVIHGGLRDDLAAAREQLAGLTGRPAAGGPAPGLTQQLRDHCRSLCGALDAHHTGEDTQGFPLLEREFPELRPAIERLRREHVEVARITADLQSLLSDTGTAAEQVRSGFERLAYELEAHFAREEDQLMKSAEYQATTDRPIPAVALHART